MEEGILGAAYEQLKAGICEHAKLALPEGLTLRVSQDYDWLLMDEVPSSLAGVKVRGGKSRGWNVGHPLPERSGADPVVGIERRISVKLEVPAGTEYLTWEEGCRRETYGRSGDQFQCEEIIDPRHWLNPRPDIWLGEPPTQLVGWSVLTAFPMDGYWHREVTATRFPPGEVVLTYASWVMDSGGDIAPGYRPRDVLVGVVGEDALPGLRARLLKHREEDPREWGLPCCTEGWKAALACAAAAERRTWHGKIVAVSKTG